MSTKYPLRGKVSRSGSVIIEMLVSLSIYSVAFALICESINMTMMTMAYLSKSEKYVEDFEDVLVYMYNEVNGNDLELISYTNWSILLIDVKDEINSNSVIAYQLFKENGRSSLIRITTDEKIDIHDLKIKRPGMSYFKEHFSGFNNLYNGNEYLSFETEDGCISFNFGKLKTYIGPSS